jgi:phosphatidylinositol glycan class B
MLVLGILLALRITNALSIKTFFQPDEYFQSLEPAWQIVFGAESGAWITWVGRTFSLSAPTIS